MCKLPILSKTSTPSQRLKEFYSVFLNEDSTRDDKFRKRINVFDSKEQEENFIFNVWSGAVTVTNLDLGLYVRTAELYEKAIDSIGYSKKLTFYKEFKQSTWLFSAAKNFRQTADMSLLLRDGSGGIKPYRLFKKDVAPIVKKYGRDYTRAEYNRAVANTQSAVQWDTIQDEKHIFPSLRYVTTGDSLVRPDHAELDNIIRGVDDPFWDSYMPQNDWECRCTVEQVTTTKSTDLRTKKIPKLPDGFNNNPGKSHKVFTKNHPYFKDVPKSFEAFKKSNFGLPLPPELFTDD